MDRAARNGWTDDKVVPHCVKCHAAIHRGRCECRVRRAKTAWMLTVERQVRTEQGSIEDLYPDDIEPAWPDRDLVKLQGRPAPEEAGRWHQTTWTVVKPGLR